MYLARRDSFWDDFFKNPFSGAVDQVNSSRLMKTDVREKDNNFEVFMDLPGVPKEDIQIELKDGYLTVSAKKTAVSEEQSNDGKFIRKERFEGSAKRSFYVGEYANEQNISASYSDGVLKIIIPKEPEIIPEQPKLITID